MKIIVIIVFILIIISLGNALFHVVKHKTDEDSQKTMTALAMRSGLSILLFIALFVAVITSFIKPHGLGVQLNRQPTASPQLTP
jgi:hypothetical protein